MTVEPFVHRDLNWLSFNERVLQEAEDKEYNPLYERIKFLAIYSSNLDEYFKVRVSQLRQIKRVEKSIRKKLALHPNKTVKQILSEVKLQQERFGRIFKDDIIPELAENGIFLLKAEDFDNAQKKIADAWFKNHVQNIDFKILDVRESESPFLEDKSLYYCALFKDENKMGFVKIPTSSHGRFVDLGDKDGAHYITFIDDLIRYKKDFFFKGESITSLYEIKLSRDAELYLDDELEGILAERIYDSLEQRQEGQPTRLLYDAAMPKEQVKKLRKLLGLGKIDMMPGGRYHNFNDFFSFPDPSKNAGLHYDKKTPIKHKVLENATDYLRQLHKRINWYIFPTCHLTMWSVL